MQKADENWFGFVMAIKMFTLMRLLGYVTQEYTKDDENTALWIDAWLTPHYRLLPKSGNVSLSTSEGTLLYEGPLSEFLQSPAAQHQRTKLAKFSIEFQQEVESHVWRFAPFITNAAPLGSDLLQVRSKAEAIFRTYRQRMGV
jgi:hypothetical protein